jgi:8-oxo-dGTP pyrophosphatase MutT (NUDIX family)
VTNDIEILARAVIERRGRFLVARPSGGDYVYLPGGHPEGREALHACLRRELREELGVRADVGRYLGLIEHGWTDAAGAHQEVNHCFRVRASGIGRAPIAREPDLEFLWLAPAELGRLNLQPAPLLRFLRAWPDSSRGGWWASTAAGRPGGRFRGGR